MKKVKKRDGRYVVFDPEKIKNAILKAFVDVDGELSDYAITKAENIAQHIEEIANMKELSIEEIQDMVEEGLARTKRKDVAKSYILYREERSRYRNIDTTLKKKYQQLSQLLNGTDEESKTENSNKDTRIIPTMRDYIAGFTCRELADNFLLPREIADAHKEGIIHFHDSDYSPTMPMTNCSLINLEDMLQNGTVISGILIEKPHSFQTACTVATQIITQVASSQYGGNTINIGHLAPFVQESRKQLKKKFPMLNNDIIEQLVQKEVKDGIQTIQYQLITMSTTNGQAPFTSLSLWVQEYDDPQLQEDLASIIKEIFLQRIAGVKNEQGIPITNAFPKLLYVLDTENSDENGKYWYLTQLAAECSARRLVPDYISAKVMRKLKGAVYPCMGCRSFLTPDPIQQKYWGRLTA